MRIIGGTHRGRRLTVPRGLSVRPTSDRVKEALFDILGPMVSDALVLDLFAGTGSLALEALSRGATAAVCVESDRRALRALRANARTTGLEARLTVYDMPVHRALQELKNEGRSFDIVFMDPPYRKGLVMPAVQGILSAELAAPEAIIAVEHASDDAETGARVAGVREWKNRKYGDTSLTFLIRVS